MHAIHELRPQPRRVQADGYCESPISGEGCGDRELYPDRIAVLTNATARSGTSNDNHTYQRIPSPSYAYLVP